jgi:aldehyde:ferredoxin oxidoreductase
MNGWMGTILRVDLTSKKITKEPLSEELRRNYLGGRGINVRILYDEVKAGTDALGPENRLIFGTGPLTGTMLSSGRTNITAMSPMTNILGDSNAGSHFSPELKFAGYDHIVFTGKADKPVYLWINDDTVELRDAQHLWGKMTDETEHMLQEEFGDPQIQVACIGPAGEKLVRLAAVMVGSDGTCGRTGMGAVMGSKNLKAIAVRGTKGVKVARPDVFRELVYDLMQRQLQCKAYPLLSTFGTTNVMAVTQLRGSHAIRNAQKSGPFEGFDGISPETLYEKHVVKDKACFGCGGWNMESN